VQFTVGLTLAALLASIACQSRTGEPPAAGAQASIDKRTPVALPPEDQQAVLREMRLMLGAMGGAMAGAARNDTVALLAALLPAGSAAAADPALEASLPPAWRDLAERTHGGFDSLAAVVRRLRGAALRDTVLVRLAELSASCTACHETFRVTLR
jgi:cytochrome c556